MKNTPIRIIEVIGPAGSGKSTLANVLSLHANVKLIASPPYYRKVTDFPFFARNALELLPLLFRLNSTKMSGGVNKRDVAFMVTLNGWSQVLYQYTSQYSILILDEGPIYYMAYLQIYGSEIMNSPFTQAWWNQIYKHWARVLDMVIMLDAPDMLLIDRIRSREKPHGVKVKPDNYAYKYLSDLREKYEYLLFKLTSEAGDLKVLRFDTQQSSINQINFDVFTAIQQPVANNK